MRKLCQFRSIMAALTLFVAVSCIASALYATSIRPADQISIGVRTIYNDGNPALPDSMMLKVYYNGDIYHSSWYDSSDATTIADDGWLIFTDQFQDIDSSGGDGHYLVIGRAYDSDSSLYTPWVYSFDVGLFETARDIEDTTNAILDTLQLWDDEIADMANIRDTVNAALDTLQNQDDWVAKEATVNGLNDFDPLSDSVMVDMSVLDSTLKKSKAGRALLSLAPHFGWVSSLISAGQFKIGGPMTAYGDDYFNDLQLIFVDGDLLGRASRVTDWSSSDSTITVNPFSSQPALYDTFVAAPNLDISASADIPDSTAARIDSILASVGAFSDTSITAKLGDYSGAAGDNNNIKDDIAAVSTQGGGTEPETLFVFDSDTTAIEGVSVTVRNLDQTSTKVPGHRTDSSGKVFLELDPDSFVVVLYANNYFQSDLDTIVVATGGGTDTVWMNRFDPGNPPSPDLCRVYGWVYDITGDSLEGVSVISEIPPEFHPVKYSDVIITPFKKTTETDSAGYWQIDLLPNSLLSDTDSKYLFIIEYPSGVVFRTRVEVPDSTSWQLK
jgi:hypothetical protein